ncbi:MAG: adenylate/guanylate cyclase domain-containing protein [Actinomycetota bacterium]
MPTSRDVRRVGADAVQRLRRTGGERLADLLQRDPETMARAVELGLVRREWVERPGEEPLRTAGPVEVLQRWLEGEVERRPSTIAKLGLSAVQILSSNSDDDTTDGVPDTLTVVFTDLEGFTAYTARNGDEAASRLLTEHQRTVGPIVRGRGGRTVKHLGDGLLVTFASAEAAVLAGLELVEAHDEPLRMRVGLNVGEVRITPTDDVVGHVVNVAARVVEAARGSEVLATAAVRAACGPLPGVRFGRIRKRGFKGVDESIEVCPVTRA